MKIRILMLFLAVFVLPLTARAEAIQGTILRVGFDGLYRPGSWIPVQVRLENRTGKQFEGRLAVEQIDLDGDRVLCEGKPFILNPDDVNGRVVWTYFWPRPDEQAIEDFSVLVLDKSGKAVATINQDPMFHKSLARIPQVSGDSASGWGQGRSARAVAVLGTPMGWKSYFNMYGGTEEVRVGGIPSAAQLPDDVRGYDALDVLVWQADVVKVSDITDIKPMLAWVRAGGHLIISVGTQGQEFVHAEGPLLSAMPIDFTGTRQLPAKALVNVSGCGLMIGDETPFVQATGTVRKGARIMPVFSHELNKEDEQANEFKENPLVVTGAYGRGAVTVLTLNAGNGEMAAKINNAQDWVRFWNMVAGWQDGSLKEGNNLGNNYSSPATLTLSPDVAKLVDVTEVTEVRTLVAVLFLLGYWVLAGPVGHLVLKHYKVTHWSWWVFGGMVMVATTIAGLVVFGLHVASTDVRHKSYVIGTVNSRETSILGFYGVYAPQSGAVEIKVPEAEGQMNFLMPMNIPMADSVKGYADPQSYSVSQEHGNTISPMFRTTLKKLQGRFTVDRPGIEGNARFSGDASKALVGSLVNNTGYDLSDVNIAVFGAKTVSAVEELRYVHLYQLRKDWKKGSRITLEKDLILDRLAPGDKYPATLADILECSSWKLEEGGAKFGGLGRSLDMGVLDRNGKKILYDQPVMMDLLTTLYDVRKPDGLFNGDINVHCEPIRGILRLIDCTKLLHASGAVIVAHAGDLAASKFVESPVPVSVAGSQIAGKGDVLFVYALPVEGVPPDKFTATKPAAATASQPGPRRGETLLPPVEGP